ncbi:tyrosine-type recombinase/integrase [Numidum massiliense]|uniref:tyrosine-type recombinase/integrase n=1 Tax=Numidum massiliense TaxID=1522315 RepID=UPI0006D57F26|nr:tyrosine-type recombinase/integrase [Numidum massiliense]
MSKPSKRKGKPTKKERDALNDEHLLQGLFDKFYRVKVAEGRAERTLRGYRENFGYFMDYLNEKGMSADVRLITTDLIREYVVHMLREKVRFDGHRFKPDYEKRVGLSPVTVNTRLKTLRVFFGFLHDEEIIDRDPMKSVKNVAEAEELPDIFTANELKRILKAPNLRLYSDFRDYTIMHVLLDTFVRTGEALSLKTSDINFDMNTIMVRAEVAKGRRTRVLPISTRTANLLRELIRENSDFDSDYVFLTNYGEQLPAENLRNRLKKFAEVAGIKKRVYPYLFRHTGATMYLEAGGDLRHLQLILGHKDLRIIKRYTHLSQESVRRQHGKYTPLNHVIGNRSKPRKIKRSDAN